ncbi:MAG TPA: glycosyltransferase family 4 protein [Candidatus Methanoperedens sp.]
MKIAMSSRAYDRKGGISRYVAELAERFADEHEVHIFTSKWEDVNSDSIIFHTTPLPPGPLLVEAGAYFVEMSLISKFMRGKFDIIHTEGLESAWLDVVTAHSIHRGGLESMKNIGDLQSLGVMDKFLLAIEKMNYSRCRNYRKIIADSTSSKEELIKFYNVPDEDIAVIPLGVNLDEYSPMDRKGFLGLRRKYGINENDIVLLIVATEFRRKGIVELIFALGILKKKMNNIKLVIIGEPRTEGARKGTGYYRDLAIKEGVEKEVIFTGFINDLNSYFNMSNIFVFPTKYEAFGIPTLEAMAAGLPVLNSKIGAGELITDGFDGIHLDDPGNVNEIADKLEMLIRDEKLRKELGRNARKTAMKYSWDETAKRTMEVYEQILK